MRVAVDIANDAEPVVHDLDSLVDLVKPGRAIALDDGPQVADHFDSFAILRAPALVAPRLKAGCLLPRSRRRSAMGAP